MLLTLPSPFFPLPSFLSSFSPPLQIRAYYYNEVPVVLKERVTRFKNVNTRKYLISYGEEARNETAPAGTQSYVWSWSFSKDGRLFSEGKKYTLKVITTLPKSGVTGTSYVRMPLPPLPLLLLLPCCLAF